MKKQAVHIVISDKGWILERLAHELSSRLPYVSYDTLSNPDAKIQYYMTYGTYNGRVSETEIGFFTHCEDNEAAAKKFYATAAVMDICVAMSLATENLLKGRATKTCTILPGVDLDRFKPKLRIGIVGRTYHTGRKGEDLVSAVQDIEEIEWVFTGKGWPGPSQFVPEEQLPEFYRSLDYVLVPSRIEGGPMCVLEALASGVEVIAPPIGWVPEFPHIEFETNNAVDLRRVLLAQVEKRAALRRTVEMHTWNAWAANHHALFADILGVEALNALTGTKAADADMHAAVAVHGVEMSESAGGPSVRAPLTARLLRRVGVNAEFMHTRAFDAEDFDVVHVMNVWQPENCETLLRQAGKADTASVLSPIYLDLSEHDAYTKLIPEIFRYGVDDRIALPAYEAVRNQLSAQREAGYNAEIAPGYFDKVRRLVGLADHIIFLSANEQEKLRRLGIEHPSTSIIHNPVTATTFGSIGPELFEETFGIKDYVLMVGRIERRKNQLTLAYALRDCPYPVVFIGHSNDDTYLNLVKQVGGPNAHFVGRITPNSELLASAYAGARVFCFPSWSEGASLAVLEAAATGCRMILSNRSSEREYFQDRAQYCDPADPANLRKLVEETYTSERSEEACEELKDHVRNSFGWARYAEGTREAYEKAIANHARKKEICARAAAPPGHIFVDLTTLVHRDGPPSGIARAEDRLSIELVKLYPERIRFIVWNSHFQCFLPVRREWVEEGKIKHLRGADAAHQLLSTTNKIPYKHVRFASGDVILIFGGAWIRNQNYLRDLVHTKRACNVALVSTIYDVIQWKFKEWFPADVGADFSKNCARLLRYSDRVLTCSQKSKDDIVEFAIKNDVVIPPIDVFRLGDAAVSVEPDAQIQISHIATVLDKPFVLYVSAIDVRKNHRLLLEVWERLTSEFGAKAPELVLVGSLGWNAQAVTSMLAASENLSKKVHLLHGINDPTLEWLYKNCLFTVYPSLYEGWGLPIAESLKFGKFCLASNAGSIPEIAPHAVELLDPRNFMAWYEKIVRYSFWPKILEERQNLARGYKPYSWSSAAEFIASKIAAMSSTESIFEFSTGVPVSFARSKNQKEQPAEELVVGGWGNFENGGSWTIGSNAAICFKLSGNRTVALKVLASAFMPKGTVSPQTVRILVNGVSVGAWNVSEQPQWFGIPLYENLVEESGKVVVELAILEPRAPRDYDPANADTRLLGINVKSIVLEAVIDFPADTWLSLADLNSNSVIVSEKFLGDGATYLAIDAEVVRPCSAVVQLGGEVLGTIHLSPGQGQIRALKVPPRCSENGRPSFLTLTSPTLTPIQLLRLGAFRALPPEAIQALQPSGAVRLSETTLDHVPCYGKPILLPFGSGVEFKAGQPIVAAMAGGWHAPEAHGVWSDGSPSSFYLQLIDIDSEIVVIGLSLQLYDWIFALGSPVEMKVKVGTHPVRTIVRKTSEPQSDVFEVPVSEAVDSFGRIPVTICGERGIIPRRVDGGEDQRALSFFLLSAMASAPPGAM